MQPISFEQAIFFEEERRHRCIAARERDLAATATDPARRAMHLLRASKHHRRIASPAEHLLIR